MKSLSTMFDFMAGEGLVGIKFFFEGRGRTIGKRRLGRRERSSYHLNLFLI